MANYFESFLDGLRDVATRLQTQLENAAEQTVFDRCELEEQLESGAEQTVFDRCELEELSSITRLAEADMLVLADEEQRNGPLSPEKRQHASGSAQTIVNAIPASIESNYFRSEASVVNTATVRSAATVLEQLSGSVELVPAIITTTKAAQSPSNTDDILDTRIRRCLNALYSGLTKRLLSDCNHKHVARLKLTGFNTVLDHQTPLLFDLFLSSHFDWKPCRWLQIHCTIEETLNSVNSSLCDFVQESEIHKQLLKLRIGEEPVGSLMREPVGSPIHDGSSMLSNENPTVSLKDLIAMGYFNKSYRAGIVDKYQQNRHFLPSERASLCCTLARSLLHLSHGPWKRVNWSIDGIFFLEDPSTGRLSDKDQPYLTWTFNRSEGTNPSQNDPSTHNQILINFARLIIEIYGHQQIQIDQSTENLQEVLYGCLCEISDQNVYQAVEACLGSGGVLAAQDDSSPDRLKVFIHQHVLLPLEESKANYIRPINNPNSTTRPTVSALTQNSQSPYDGKENDTPQNILAAQRAEEFLIAMKDFTTNIGSQNQGPPIELPLHLNSKIKIAIIDSGVSKSDMKILGAMSKIQGRNFQRDAAHDKWDDDTHGHGTHISRLLLEIAPQADLYIAKVTNGHCMEQDVIGCITAAVNWTVQVWDVDIISLSLVVHEKNDSLKEALKQALDPQYDQSRRRIVFAAAGNTGGIRPMGWLASMPNVIAIHATDGFGNPAGFNPTSLEKFSFATLGQDIKSRWKVTGKCKNVYLSGTSFATPIAAAIAANVLEWARWNLELTPDQKKLLYSPGKMKLIFETMQQGRTGLHFVQPWTLWKQGHDQVIEDLKNIIAS